MLYGRIYIIIRPEKAQEVVRFEFGESDHTSAASAGDGHRLLDKNDEVTPPMKKIVLRVLRLIAVVLVFPSIPSVAVGLFGRRGAKD